MSDECAELEKRSREYAEKTLRSMWSIQAISWYNNSEPGSVEYYLDRFMGIDGKIRTTSGISFTFQAKCRDYEKYDRFGDWTLEHMSNDRGAEGEFFHLAADIYIYGWENLEKNDFEDVYVFYISPVKRAIMSGQLRHTCEKPNWEYGTATFRCYDWEDFNPLWILHHKGAPI